MIYFCIFMVLLKYLSSIYFSDLMSRKIISSVNDIDFSQDSYISLERKSTGF